MKYLHNIKASIIITIVAALMLVSQQQIFSQRLMDQKTNTTLPAIPEGHDIATLAAGCYWCVEAVYERISGVHSVTSGFTGGHVENPTYEAVCAETTGHTEAVRIVYDPKKISYENLLSWFWRLHDPTTLNRQGADVGTQYRSGIYYHNDAQKKAALASRTEAQKNFPLPIVTEIFEISAFYPAKVSHQDYYRINGQKDGYCRMVVAPKLKKLKLEK